MVIRISSNWISSTCKEFLALQVFPPPKGRAFKMKNALFPGHTDKETVCRPPVFPRRIAAGVFHAIRCQCVHFQFAVVRRRDRDGPLPWRYSSMDMEGGRLPRIGAGTGFVKKHREDMSSAPLDQLSFMFFMWDEGC